MPEFNSILELEKWLLPKLQSVMQNEVAEVIKKEESNQIKQKLYAEFEPLAYERRKDNDGLSDVRNMIATTKTNIHGVTTVIENMTKGNPKYGYKPNDEYIAGIIANGGHYQYHSDVTSPYYERPRLVNTYTVEALQGNRRHISAIIEGLQKYGIYCE